MENYGIADFFGVLFFFPFYVYFVLIIFNFIGEIKNCFRISNRAFRYR